MELLVAFSTMHGVYLPGLRAAFRAYRNAIETDGPDPRLPGPLLDHYDHDQLFFLSYAETWCASVDIATTMIRYDSHSPPKYRLLGSLRNLPAFATAYHCPRNSTYSPKDRCEVWIS